MRFFQFFTLMILCWPYFGYAQDYDDQAKKLDKEIKRIEKLQEKDRKKQEKVRQQLKQTNRELKTVNKQLNKINADLKNQRSLVAKLEKKSAENQTISAQSQSMLSALLLQFSKQQRPNFLQILLSQSDANELDRHQVHLSYYARARQQQLESLRIALQSNESASQEYTERQQALKQQYEQQKKLKQKIAQQNTKKNKLLKSLESGIAEKSTAIKKLKEDKKRLAALIKRLEEKRKAKAKANREFVPAKGGFTKQKGRLLLPVSGKVKVAYGQKLGSSGLRSNGIQIKAHQSGRNSVRAIYEGRVIFANWLKGFGNLLIIEHGNGYLSLYGNNQVLNKKEGDIVAAREVIASFNQQNNRTNFYFEMRRQGKPVNPSTWLRK